MQSYKLCNFIILNIPTESMQWQQFLDAITFRYLVENKRLLQLFHNGGLDDHVYLLTAIDIFNQART